MPATLDGWLAYLETLHPKTIALGLERVREVRARLDATLACPVIVVAGTNGKGSTCALIDSMLRAGGYHTGLYTSPHLLVYNERVRIDGVQASDEALCAAFEAVERVRDDVALTYFEFGTLAALWLFAQRGLDVVVLEVGLGGRLDAVNVVDADVAIVTTVAIDHVDWLGGTRVEIAREKAGVFRNGRVAICGDADPPETLVEAAQAVGARLLRRGPDYGFQREGAQWRYRGPAGERYGLPHPALRGTYQLANAATALTALFALGERLPLPMAAVRAGLVAVDLEGRFQVLPGRPSIVLDVAHNPEAAGALGENLAAQGSFPSTCAVFGSMADKDVAGVVAAVKPRIDRWHVASLPLPRGAQADALATVLAANGVAAEAIERFGEPQAAFRRARERAQAADRIVVFGSFLTVSAALSVHRKEPRA